uniref:DUF4848 domain-containing protein n=1 Tax=uncultured Dysgonomonas sp. TaxID=206096 RepID=UPI002619ED31|nr:DUF4848 domain-containing protein [uncultured Dysgonomonas sp.]
MKKVTYLILAFVSMFFLSCSDDELANNNIEINKSESKIKVVKIPVSKLRSAGIDDVEKDEYVLQFEDQDAFNNIADTLNKMSLDEKLQWNKEYEEIYSIVQEYNKAMVEAESYYERAGGYEEFKAKYPNLYFPEEGEDFGAYIPFKDETLAFCANKNGRYMIGDEIKSLDRVETYNDLIESGRADIEEEPTQTVDLQNTFSQNKEIQTRTIAGLKGQSPDDLKKLNQNCYAFNIEPGTWWFDKTMIGNDRYRHSTGWRQYGDRKIKVNFDRSSKRNYWALVLTGGFDVEWHYEVSFRKKGFLGRWYNYSSETTTNISIQYFNPDGSGSNVTQKMGKTISGWSSHDQWANCNDYIIRHINIKEEWSNVYNDNTKGRAWYVKCVYEMPSYWATITVNYRGIGQTLTFAFAAPRLYGFTYQVGDKLGMHSPF